MDPNANLEEQIRLSKLLVELEENNTSSPVAAARLAELVLALDEWLNKGGCQPLRWGILRSSKKDE